MNNNWIILLVITLLLFSTVPVVLASDIKDNTESDFKSGTFNDTQFNTTSSWVELDAVGLSNEAGSYLSNIKDLGSEAEWNSIEWIPQRPTGKELPDNSEVETDYPIGNIDMTDNTLLMHMNEPSSTIQDSSGKDNDGTTHGNVTYGVEGKFKSAFEFDGMGDHITVSDDNSLDIRSAMTVASWVDPTNIMGPPQTILSKQKYTLKEYDDNYIFEVIGDNSSETWSKSGDIGTTPSDLVVYKNKLYATNFDSDDVYSFDGSSWTKSGDVGANPVGLAVYNGKLYVSNNGSNDIYVFDGSSWTKSGDVGSGPGGIAVYRDKLYVADTGSNDVYSFDGSSWTKSGDVGNTPIGLAVYKDKLYAANSGSDDVYSFDGSSWTKSGDVGNGPRGLAVYNGKLYVSNNGSNDIYVFDGSSWTKSGDVGNGPRGLAVYDGKLYSANRDSDDIYVFDGSSWTKSGDVGASPVGLAVYNGKLFVTASADDAVYEYGKGVSVWGSRESNFDHLAGVIDNGNISLYKNGILESSESYSFSVTSSMSPLYIGRGSGSTQSGRTGGNDEYFSGSIDEVAIWKKTLTSSTIKDLYLRGALRLKHQIRSCDDSACSGENFIGPDGTNSTFYSEINNDTTTTPSFSLTSAPDSRYFQYKSFFETDTSSSSPKLNSFTINYTAKFSTKTDDDDKKEGRGPSFSASAGTPPQPVIISSRKKPFLSIEQGAEVTPNRKVTVELNARNTREVALSEDKEFKHTSFKPFPDNSFSKTLDFTLSKNTGTKTIYARFLSPDGLFKEAKDSIKLQTNKTDNIACTMQYDPVCGQDGKTYPNSCVATKQNNVEIKHKGKCASKEKDNTCPLTKQQPYTTNQTNAVYYITKDCTKRPFSKPRIFFTYFDSWQDVNQTDSSTLSQISDDSLGFMPFGPLKDFKSGSLLKNPASPTVYLLRENNQKCEVNSMQALNKLNLDPAKIKDVDQRVLDKYDNCNKKITTETNITSTDTSSYTFNRRLEQGSRGQEVINLQQILNQLGYLQVEPTGYYGNLTSDAVARLQQNNDLSSVGEVGPRTRDLLENLK